MKSKKMMLLMSLHFIIQSYVASLNDFPPCQRLGWTETAKRRTVHIPNVSTKAVAPFLDPDSSFTYRPSDEVAKHTTSLRTSASPANTGVGKTQHVNIIYAGACHRKYRDAIPRSRGWRQSSTFKHTFTASSPHPVCLGLVVCVL